MNYSKMFDKIFVFVLMVVCAESEVNADKVQNECSTNNLNVYCTFISQYESQFKRTPNNCYRRLELITEFSILNCNEHFLFELFRENDKNHVIGYKNDNLRDLMRKLKRIQWSHNKLQSLEPANFSMFSDLKSIDVAHNKLNHLMPGVFNAVASTLRVLTLSHNNISHIDPMVFDKLSTLEVLSLDNNKLETLPTFRQASLKELHLNNNHLKSIDGDFHSQFPLVDCVYLMHNQLIELILYDNGPTEIYLQDNRLTKVKIIITSSVSFLKRLHLQNNKLSQIETSEHGDDKVSCNLNYVDLTSNNVTDLSFLAKLRQLRNIRLANNNLSQVKNDDFRRLFIALRHLESLDLGTCRIEHLEEQFVSDGNYSGASEITDLNE